MSRVCTTCGILKDNSEYNKKAKPSQNGDVYKTRCRRCDSEYGSKWQRENKARVRVNRRRHYTDNKEKYLEMDRVWGLNNPDKKGQHRANRRAKMAEQTPELTPAEMAEVGGLYEYHQIFNAVMPEKKWHVDHILALANGGIHHPENLQVLTAEDNLRKSYERV